MGRIATIALAKDPLRIGLVVGTRLAIGVFALATGIGSAGVEALGTALTAVGAVVTLYAIGLAVALAALRVEVFPDEVHLASLWLRKRFRLRPGPMSRWRPSGQRKLSARVAGFGIRLGEAHSAEGEELTIMQLDPRRAVLLIPTADGRLGVAVDDEDRLIDSVLFAASRSPEYGRSR